MAPQRPFRALSLDFWFTTLYYKSGSDNLWKEDRIRVLGQVLKTSAWEDFPAERIEEAMEAVHSEFRRRDRELNTIDPETLVTAYAEHLDARLAVPVAGAGVALSSAGLDEHPPQVNSELNALARALSVRNVPIIAITNTARREASWKQFLDPRTTAPFLHIVTSCEVGRAKPAPEIFRDAARRLGLPPHEILHVGDRWELDVEGAQEAGYGAVLYRGLWSHYPEGLYPETDYGLHDDPEVQIIDHLDELLEGNLLESASPSFPVPSHRPPD
ncbi:MAG: HAD family hydrolase [Thermoplasmata archaeon]|nr:HAD family hydrolase [Thermoplasmata archaeon]